MLIYCKICGAFIIYFLLWRKSEGHYDLLKYILLESRIGTYGAIQLSEAAFFKVSFLTLVCVVVFGNKLINGGLDHVLDLIVGVGLSILARLSEGLLHSVGERSNLSIDLGIGV